MAVKLSKICNDFRLMASGPRCGLNEINLPPKAPGSSIMPGKVNPVIPEVTNQVCFKVIGNDTAISLPAKQGQMELNVMEPVITECLFESLVAQAMPSTPDRRMRIGYHRQQGTLLRNGEEQHRHRHRPQPMSSGTVPR